jgi:GNAT superfamily N-acetyltransferase
MMTTRTDAAHPDFIALVHRLDADLAIRDGEDHAFYAQFNTLHQIRHVVIAYDDNNIPVGCGAIKAYGEGQMEVKRMYTLPEARGGGIASMVLRALEQWAIEMSCESCILETGFQQPEAIALYEKNGYRRIANYGQYAGVGNSICFEKKLNSPGK